MKNQTIMAHEIWSYKKHPPPNKVSSYIPELRRLLNLLESSSQGVDNSNSLPTKIQQSQAEWDKVRERLPHLYKISYMEQENGKGY